MEIIRDSVGNKLDARRVPQEGGAARKRSRQTR